MDNNKKALKSGIWYVLSSFLIKGIGFITTPIFTRLLSKAEFGLFNNYTSWLSILSIFVTLNLEATLISARYDYEDDFDGYIFSMIGLSSLSTIVWMIALQILRDPIAAFTNVDSIYLNIMMVYLLFSPVVQMFIARERYLFEYRGSVLASAGIAISTAVISIWFVTSFDNRLLGRILGAAIPTIGLGILLVVFFIKKGKRINLSYWLYAIPVCLPYIPHLLAGTLLNSVDRVMIERFCGPEDTAIYSLAYTCGTIVTLLVTALNSAFAPWMSEKLHYKQYEEINKFSKLYISVFMLFAFGLMLIAPDVLMILGGKPYIDAKYVITPVAMGCVCQFLYTLYVNVEQFKLKTVGMALATVIAAVINFVLNYLFIPKVGYLAAAYTTLVGFLALLLMHIYLVHRLGLSKVYNIKCVFLAVVVGILGMILITFSFDHLLLRISLIVVYAIVIIGVGLKNKDKIKQLYKSKSLK